jgi:predicted ATPase
MASDREKLESETIEQLADRMQDGPSTMRHYYSALAELERRKAVWQFEAAEAEKAAASSAESTAQYTKENARHMLRSVWAILFAAVLSALFSWLAWQFPHH